MEGSQGGQKHRNRAASSGCARKLTRFQKAGSRDYFFSGSASFFFFPFFFSFFGGSFWAKETETAPIASDRPSIKVINFLMCLEFSFRILGRHIRPRSNDRSPT